MSDRTPKLIAELEALIHHARAASSQTQSESKCDLTIRTASRAPLPRRSVPAAEDSIFIPQEYRGKRITELSISVRLRHVLENKKLVLLGDLHAMQYSQFLRFRNCGRNTTAELHEVVRRLQREVHSVQSAAPEAPSLLQHTGRFSIPFDLHDVNPFELPISVRLENALRSKGVKRLGDLHDLSICDFGKIHNCGKKTVRELEQIVRRVIAGEFRVSAPFSPANCGQLLRTFDDTLMKLSARDRDVLLYRLGGANGCIRTLEEIGTKLGLTRERVRQIETRALALLPKVSGPGLVKQCQGVSSICNELVSPLTPDLLAQWLGVEAPRCRWPLAFYVRLIGELHPPISTWPLGYRRSFAVIDKQDTVADTIEEVLRNGHHVLSFKQAFDLTRQRAYLRDLTSEQFLAALQRTKNIAIDLSRPDQPKVRLRTLRLLDVAKIVLATSDMPLAPEAILARAQEKFGKELADWSPQTIANALLSQRGFFLLAPRAYGLREHFTLTEKQWVQAQNDAYCLLKKLNRPASTGDILCERTFGWADQTTKHEFAEVLRQDVRFIDLGRLLFGLAEWGVEERKSVKELVPEILARGGRPMTIAQIFDQLQQFRSVASASLSHIVRAIQEVRDYGFGHYGLKNWGDSVKPSIVADATLVERVIRRAVPPLTFWRLCEILGIPCHGQLADKLWHTCSALPNVLRIPEDCSTTGRLIHKSCRLERALVATARELNRPLPLYEFHWELNDRFGPLFATKSPDELRRALEQNSMFLRNAADEFILDIHMDQLGLDANAIRGACAEVLAEANEIVGCEDLLERIETNGQSWEELSPDILSSMLRDDPTFQEVGCDRFRLKACKR